MGRILPELCGVMMPTFLEALASCIVEDAEGNTFLNVICYTGDCNNFSAPGECGEMNDAESLLLKNAFGFDACGKLALKLHVCGDTEAENNEN